MTEHVRTTLAPKVPLQDVHYNECTGTAGAIESARMETAIIKNGAVIVKNDREIIIKNDLRWGLAPFIILYLAASVPWMALQRGLTLAMTLALSACIRY